MTSYPKTSHDFSFSQDSSILLLMSFPTWPLPSSPNSPCVTYHLTHFSALTGLPKLVSALGFHSFCFASGKPLCQSESQQDKIGTQKFLQMKWTFQRCGQHLGSTAREIRHPHHLHSKRRTGSLKRACLTRAIAKVERLWRKRRAAGIRGRTKPRVSQLPPLLESIHWLNQQEVRRVRGGPVVSPRQRSMKEER